MIHSTTLTRQAIAPSSETGFERATREQLRIGIPIEDLLTNEFPECADQLQAAILTGDAALIGKVVLAVRNAYAERLANHAEFGGSLKLPFAAAAASKVIAGARS